MDDAYNIVDCALRSHYLELMDLPKAPVWHLLPLELRSALADALAAGADLRTLVALIWQVRARLHGPPTREERAARTLATVRLRLGLLYLRYREGRMGANELLWKAWDVADSYVCDVDPRPFSRLRRELEGGAALESVAPRIAALFSPYAAVAAECVERWGLSIPVVPAVIRDT